MTDICVVPMTEVHIPFLAELERICFKEPWSERGLAAELDNPNARFFTALCGGRVVGYAGMHVVMGEGYIANLAVCPELRGMGIGRMLMRRLIELAETENMELLTLEVRPSNTAAVQLYKSLGFEPVGRRRYFYRYPTEDALLMSLYPHNKPEKI